MNELLEKNQTMSIVPQNFKNSNKGKVVEIKDDSFLCEIFHDPEGIAPKKIMEFYSQTKNGMLYFTSHVTEIKENILTVAIPIKHRFLQRRAYTRIKFMQNLTLEASNEQHKVESMDLSAGGMKLKVNAKLNIDAEYDLKLTLSDNNDIKCKYQLIKIEKNEDGSYTLSGRFNDLTNTDRMKLIQFCMRKNTENLNR